MFGKLWCFAACFSLMRGLARRRGIGWLLLDALLCRTVRAAALACGSESTFAQQNVPQHLQTLQFSMRFAQFLPPKKCWLVSYTTLARNQNRFARPCGSRHRSRTHPESYRLPARSLASKSCTNRALAMPAWPSSWAAHHQQLTTRSAGATDGCEKSAAPRDAGHLLTNS